jgi:putative transposase
LGPLLASRMPDKRRRMPRGPRLDIPGALHHDMVRGIDRQDIFLMDADRNDLLSRLGKEVLGSHLMIYGWALMSNHFHLLLRSGSERLSATMRRLLTGYAVRFNRRHRRWGHLFQNRYKSILVDEDSYLLELVRYIHLNPLRVGMVNGLEELDRYPWTGHSSLVGSMKREWQDVDFVLSQFGQTAGTARARYREFVASGTTQGRREDLEGGGLVRSMGGWDKVLALRRGRERWVYDERVLGSSDFIEEIWKEAQGVGNTNRNEKAADVTASLENLFTCVAEKYGLKIAELSSGSRRREVVEARGVVSYVAVRIGDLGRRSSVNCFAYPGRAF